MLIRGQITVGLVHSFSQVNAAWNKDKVTLICNQLVPYCSARCSSGHWINNEKLKTGLSLSPKKHSSHGLSSHSSSTSKRPTQHRCCHSLWLNKTLCALLLLLSSLLLLFPDAAAVGLCHMASLIRRTNKHGIKRRFWIPAATNLKDLDDSEGMHPAAGKCSASLPLRSQPKNFRDYR